MFYRIMKERHVFKWVNNYRIFIFGWTIPSRLHTRAVKVNTQIHFNGTHFIRARLTVCIFCLTRILARIWRNEDAQCCQLSDFADPFSNFFFPFKKAPSDKSLGFAQTLFSLWDSPVLPREVLNSQRAHTPLSLRLLCSASAGEEQRFQLNTDIMLRL